MHSFRWRRGQLTCTFEPTEITVYSSLVTQLIELLTSDDMPKLSRGALGGDSDEQDVFAELEREFNDEPETNFCTDPDIDPVLRRLFPDAYRDDPAASGEFRKYSQTQQRNEKLDAAVTVVSDLNQISKDGRCTVPDDHVEPWLKTLTALRLALSVRLGIATAEDQDALAELPDDDPKAAIFSIYEWLGWMQESLLECLH